MLLYFQIASGQPDMSHAERYVTGFTVTGYIERCVLFRAKPPTPVGASHMDAFIPKSGVISTAQAFIRELEEAGNWRPIKRFVIEQGG